MVPEFIRVMGDDLHYKGRTAPLFLNTSSIARIYPEWAEEKEGTLYRCPHDHEKARVVGYTLVDPQGNKYSCADKEELARLGVELEAKRGPLGFAIQEDTTRKAP